MKWWHYPWEARSSIDESFKICQSFRSS